MTSYALVINRGLEEFSTTTDHDYEPNHTYDWAVNQLRHGRKVTRYGGLRGGRKCFKSIHQAFDLASVHEMLAEDWCLHTWDSDLRAAGIEAALRKELATLVAEEQRDGNLSVRVLAAKLGMSKSQVQRLRLKEQGGSITLRTLTKVCDFFDFQIQITRKKP